MTFLGSQRRALLALAAILLAAAAVILGSGNAYYLMMLGLVSVWAVLGLSWTILGGYAGLVSFGHAAFFGVGAYTVAILFHHWGVSPWIGWPLGGAVGAVLGLVIGAITFRLKGHYFSLAMLAYPLALLPVFNWAGWTEMTLPLQHLHPAAFMQFDDPRIVPLIGLALLGTGLLLCLRIERARLGLILFAIRQDELAARTSGIAVLRWKLRAIALSGGLAGLAGGLYAVLVRVVTPDSSFGMLVSAQALIVSMFGGLGTAWGPLIGAVLLIPAAEILNATVGARLPGVEGVVFGLAIMIVILWRPQGVFWAVRDALAGPQRPPAVAAAAMAPESVPVPGPVPATGGVLLSVQGMSVAFGGVKALSDVSFDIAGGEIVGIIGPNGAGKTTLFNALNGLVRPTAGQAVFEGRPLAHLAPQDVCRLGIGRTFQTVRAFPRLTLLENVAIGAFAAERSDAAALQRARAAVARVGLADRALAPAGSLTNRELRLMELARALAGGPRLVLMDESFAGLSSADIEVMIALLLRLRADGLTIAIIEHTMQAMLRLADRFIVLDHGTPIASGCPRDVVRDRTVIAAYLGRRWVERADA
jgi:ABC-type branched-subunit amino acid transport system ATPase component/ABC-type branched-subunit amino acid transport system permease subunit